MEENRARKKKSCRRKNAGGLEEVDDRSCEGTEAENHAVVDLRELSRAAAHVDMQDALAAFFCQQMTVRARARTRYCVGPTVDSDHSCSLGSTLDERSAGFSTRRDDPSNSEFSSIDNDR
jgi:hypothetical protein